MQISYADQDSDQACDTLVNRLLDPGNKYPYLSTAERVDLALMLLGRKSIPSGVLYVALDKKNLRRVSEEELQKRRGGEGNSRILMVRTAEEGLRIALVSWDEAAAHGQGKAETTPRPPVQVFKASQTCRTVVMGNPSWPT